MANWAIAIGVNQYEFLHPLKYAKNDALHICEFLDNEAKFDRIFYFSDDSPDRDGKTTKPFRNNLLRVFKELFAQPFLHEGDNFWFFFAGHGILEDGIDYLMPSDGDPDNVVNTGIAVNHVIQNLRGSGAGNVILALDACRNQVRRNAGSRSGEGIGRDTEKKAKIADVISISACSPNEYSYEVEELKHGAFTYALVEGLGVQKRCATAMKLNDHLKRRVPELAKTTNQNPRMLLDPVEKGNLILMPKYADKSDLVHLRADAYQALSCDKWDVAKRLWMQILAVDGTDYEAIQGIEQLAVKRHEHSKIQILPGARRPPIQPTNLDTLTIKFGRLFDFDFVEVPEGQFMMGSPDGEGAGNEYPQHQVTLKKFAISKYPVTNTLWESVMETKGSVDLPNCINIRQFQGELHPVVGVTWDQAMEFCQKLSTREKRDIRLPTEAEWEYAAIGAKSYQGFIYSGSSDLDEVAWHEKNSKSCTRPVGEKTSNEIQIYDMSGNVNEWCLDEYHESYEEKSDHIKNNGNEPWSSTDSNEDIDGIRTRMKFPDIRTRILRGGAYNSNNSQCRSVKRARSNEDKKDKTIGFRIVLVV